MADMQGVKAVPTAFSLQEALQVGVYAKILIDDRANHIHRSSACCD
jgi:hypothetical protein